MLLLLGPEVHFNSELLTVCRCKLRLSAMSDVFSLKPFLDGKLILLFSLDCQNSDDNLGVLLLKRVVIKFPWGNF
jgi:hypothetical protein